MKNGHRLIWLGFAMAVILGGVIYPYIPSEDSLEFVAVWVGSAWALANFAHQHQLEKYRFFFELFGAFNARYDAMNDELQQILCSTEEPSAQQRATMVDYFNLCAEEYLLHSRGYVPKEVWRAWRNGMNVYAKSQRFKTVWSAEERSHAYYGFNFLSET